MNKWKFELFKYESVLGPYWKFIFTNHLTGEVISDIIEEEDFLTGEIVTEDQAIESARTIFYNRTGLMYIMKRPLQKVI